MAIIISNLKFVNVVFISLKNDLGYNAIVGLNYCLKQVCLKRLDSVKQFIDLIIISKLFEFGIQMVFDNNPRNNNSYLIC